MLLTILKSVPFCLLLYSSMAAMALPPYEIKTGQGIYKVIELPGIQGEFELTADHALAVVSAENQFQVLSTKDGMEIGAPLKSPADQWKVLGDELVLCEDEGWTHYALPGFEKKQTTPYPPPLTANDQIQAMACGWFCRGYVFGEEHDKIVATYRHPYTPTPANALADFDRRNTQTCIPSGIDFVLNRMSIRDYDQLPILGPESPKYRCGLNWITAAGELKGRPGDERKLKGIFIEFVGRHFEHAKYFRQLSWPGGVPMFLDERFEPADWQLMVLPNKVRMPVEIKIWPASDLIDDLNETSENHNEIFKRYVEVTTPEYEFIVGRKPKDIPMAYHTSPFGSLIWTEMSREQILARYTGNLREKEAKKAYENAVAENARIVHSHAAAIREISEENSKFMQAPPKFKANFATYAGYSAMITFFLIVACTCAFILHRLSRAFARVDQSEPPVLTPKL